MEEKIPAEFIYIPPKSCDEEINMENIKIGFYEPKDHDPFYLIRGSDELMGKALAPLRKEKLKNN